MKRLILLIYALAVVVITTATLYPVLNNGFVNLDDNVLVYDNTKIMSLSFQSVRQMFTSFHASLYHPLVLLSYAVEYRLFGADPAVYHATNLFLHLCNSLLVFWLFYILAGDTLPAFLVALLFGIHPMHVESVAWVSERKDVLYALFFLLSLVFYVRYLKEDKKQFYAVALGMFALSLLSKPMAITLPPVLILMDYLLDVPAWSRRRIIEKLPFFVVGAVFAWVTMVGQYPDHQEKLLSSMTLFNNFLVACHDVLFYLWKALLPVRLSALYPQTIPPGTMPSGLLLFGPAILLFIVAAIIFSLRYSRKVLYGFLFFVITILPVINLVPVGLGIAADRYTYIPYIGLFYIFAEAFASLYRRIPAGARAQKGTMAASLGVLFVGLSFASWLRAQAWKDDIVFYTSTIAHYDNVPIAYNNRGFARICRGEYDQALADCSEAVRLQPRYFDALNNLGNIYIVKGDYDSAEMYLKKAKTINPSSDMLYVGFGNICKHRGDYDQALLNYRKALSLNSKCDRAYYSIGFIYQLREDYGHALREYTAALGVNPCNTQARIARGDCYLNRGEYDRAIDDYSRAIEQKPSAEVYYSRGLAYEKKTAYDEAVDDFTRAITMKKDYTDAYLRRARILGMARRCDQALADYNKVLTANPRHGEAYACRAVVYFYMKDYDRAMDDVRRAKELGCIVNREFLAQLTRQVKGRKAAAAR